MKRFWHVGEYGNASFVKASRQLVAEQLVPKDRQDGERAERRCETDGENQGGRAEAAGEEGTHDHGQVCHRRAGTDGDRDLPRLRECRCGCSVSGLDQMPELLSATPLDGGVRKNDVLEAESSECEEVAQLVEQDRDGKADGTSSDTSPYSKPRRLSKAGRALGRENPPGRRRPGRFR